MYPGIIAFFELDGIGNCILLSLLFDSTELQYNEARIEIRNLQISPSRRIPEYTRAQSDDNMLILLGGLIRQLCLSSSLLPDPGGRRPPPGLALRHGPRLIDGCLSETYQPVEDAGASAPFKIPARLEDKVSLVNWAEILCANPEDGHA